MKTSAITYCEAIAAAGVLLPAVLIFANDPAGGADLAGQPADGEDDVSGHWLRERTLVATVTSLYIGSLYLAFHGRRHGQIIFGRLAAGAVLCTLAFDTFTGDEYGEAAFFLAGATWLALMWAVWNIKPYKPQFDDW